MLFVTRCLGGFGIGVIGKIGLGTYLSLCSSGGERHTGNVETQVRFLPEALGGKYE